MDESEELRRLRWQCRRGMLELDLLLSRFLEIGYAQLSEKEKGAFLRFLSCPDQILYDWLTRQAVPADAQMRQIVARIREVGGYSGG